MLKHPTDEDWLFCRQCTLNTIGKKTSKLPTDEWKVKLLRSEHSPIRTLWFAFRMEIPYWVSVHLCRHIHSQPFVRSQRNDRQSDYDRNKAPQNEPVTMLWYMNAEELMVIANKRLCKQASEETQEIVRMMCKEVLKVCPEFEGLLVPMCKYGKCHEMFPCKKGDAE